MDKSIKVRMYEPDPCYNDRKRKPSKPKKKREPNLCKKERKVEDPYEVWVTPDKTWEWRVLSKTQNPTNEAKTLLALGFVVLNHLIPMIAMNLVPYMQVKLEIRL